MQFDQSGISSLTRPAQALEGPIMPGTADVVRTVQEVTRGLGLAHGTVAELEAALRRAADSGNVLAFRKLVMESTRQLAPSNMPLRAELSRRAMMFYKHTAKPVPDRRFERLVIQKAMKPPRGAWEPLEHTVHAGAMRRRHGNHWIYWYPSLGVLSEEESHAHEKRAESPGGHPGVLAAVGRGQGTGGQPDAEAAARERRQTESLARAPRETKLEHLAQPLPGPGFEPEVAPPVIEPPSRSPAIALHPDLWPELATLPEAPFEKFPNPAPFVDSEGKVRGYLDTPATHVAEGMRRILGAWQSHDGVLLQDEAGLGKTNQALGAMVARGGKRNLIVVPTAGKEGLMAQWSGPTAAGLFNLELKRVGSVSKDAPGWWIVSYDELLYAPKNPDGTPVLDERTGRPKVILRPEIFDGQWDAVTFDESHNMATAASQRTIAGKALQGRADKVLYMSATPFTNVTDMHYLTKLGLWKDLIGKKPTKEEFPAVPRSGVIENEEQAFAYWAHMAGAKVNRAAYSGVSNPSSPLPMAAVAAVLHVDGLSIKRMTSLEGVTSKFGVMGRDRLTPAQLGAFDTATELCALANEGGINGMIVKALYVSWARQYWETLKVPEAIKLGKAALAAGKQVALYTSFKLADHRHLKAFPEMLRRRAERLDEKAEMGAPGAAATAQKLRSIAIDMDKVILKLPRSESAVSNLVAAFGGPDRVAEIHGNTNKDAQREQESYNGGQKRVVVATMAKGGTGISLHDTTGERPRVQINLSLPWSGREFNQVAGRSHRLGSKSATTMHWLVGEDQNEKHNAAKVAKRLRSMGALTTGDPEATVSVKDLADFEFGNLGPDSDDPEAMVKVAEEMQVTMEKGADPNTRSEEAQASRDWFREYATQRRAGRDVMGERFQDAQLKRRAEVFRDGRYAAEQLRKGKGMRIKWRPALQVFEIDGGTGGESLRRLGSATEKEILKAKIGGQRQTYGTNSTMSMWVPPAGMPALAEALGVHRTQVDLRTATPEHHDPEKASAFDHLADELAKKNLHIHRAGDGQVKITGDTYRWLSDWRREEAGGYGNVFMGLAQGHRGTYEEGSRYYYAMPEAHLPELVKRTGGTLRPEHEAAIAAAQAERVKVAPPIKRTPAPSTPPPAKPETIREATAQKEAAPLQHLGHVAVTGVSAAQTNFANLVRDKAIRQLQAMTEPEAEEALRTVVQLSSARTILDNMNLLGFRSAIDPAEVLMRLGVGKSMRLVVKAGGPFIGPRGGKWADAQHTESWVDPRQIELPHHATPLAPFRLTVHGEEDAAWRAAHRAEYSENRKVAEAGGEMSRARMRRDGWAAVSKMGALHRHGYQVVVWINPAKIKAAGNVPQADTGGELANKLIERGKGHGTVMYEYLPRPDAPPGGNAPKRMTATDGDQQREVHRYIGAGSPDAGTQLPMFKSVTDADLAAMRPRLVLREAPPGPWELLWLTEEVPDELGVQAGVLPPGWGEDRLGKGVGHKYIKRLPTGRPGRRWRYIYALPDGSTVNSTELVAGAKFAITHLGKTGHFEVRGTNANGTVAVKHDESGRTINIRPHDMGAWFTAHHARRTAEVAAKVERAKTAPTLERSTIAAGGYDQVDGFSADARALEVQAASMDPSRHYLVIPQAGGFVLASRSRHAPTPGQALGEPTKVFVRDERGTGIHGMDAEYVVMEASGVTASHDAMTFDKNPRYPVGVQERRYESVPSEQLKIERIANNLEPRLVANTNPDAINGTPVINSDGVVLGGNGRTMGIQRAYQQYPERAAALKQFLVHHAKAFGALPAHVAALKQPILVRRIHAGEDKAVLTRLGRRMNEPLMQGLDPRSEEVAVSRFVTQEVVDSLTHHMEADQSLGDFLSRPNSAAFVKDVERAGIIDQYSRSKYLDEKTGLLNDDGKTRVTRVLAARMVPDADLLDAMPVSWRESLARATPYLLQAEHAGWDLRPALTAAARLDREMQTHGFGRTGKDRRAYFAQQGLFGTTEHEPIIRTMLGVLQDHADKVRSFPQAWKQVSLEAARQSHDYGLQGALFTRAPVTLEQAVEQAFGAKKPKQTELLAAEQEGEAAARRVMAYTRGDPGAQLALSMEMRKSHYQVGGKAQKLLQVLAKAEQRDALHGYLSRAVVWELNNQMRGALWASGGEGKIDGTKIVTRLQAFVRDQVKRDPVFARALGAHPLTPAVLRALVQAQGRANLASIVKSLAWHQMDLEKALRGPFIGPKGGKWADAAHTVSWHAPEAIQPLLTHKGPDPFALADEAPDREHSFRYASQGEPPAISGTVHREVEGQWIVYSKQPIKLDTVMEHKLAPLGNARGHTVLEHAQRLRVPVELKADWGTADNPRAAALWPNPRVGWQMSHFDSHGASGHMESADPVKLVNEALQDGYTQFEPGVVDQIVDPVKVAEMARNMAERDAAMKKINDEIQAPKIAREAKRAENQKLFHTDWEGPKLTVKDIKVGKPGPKIVDYRQPTGTASSAREPLTSPPVQEWFKKPLSERQALLRQERARSTGLPWEKSAGRMQKAEVPVGTVHQWADGDHKKVGPNQWEPVAGPQQPGAVEPVAAPRSTALVVPLKKPGKKPAPPAGKAAPAQAQAGKIPAQAAPQQGGAPTTFAAAPAAVAKMKPAKVGVGAFDVPPPPSIPRLPGLPPEQAEAEAEFAEDFEKNADAMVDNYLAKLAAGQMGEKPGTFSTDDAKMLSSRYNQPGNLAAKGQFNLAVHQTANAIAKRAFVKYLDTLAKLPEGDPKRSILVTAGGVASGKGYALGEVAETKDLVGKVGAVWDSAGEQNSTELPWVLQEARKRGLHTTFVFVDADPEKTWENPERGVIERATKIGRMVDAHLYADSYGDGAAVFQGIYDQEKAAPDVTMVLLQNRGKPKLLTEFPKEALVDKRALYKRASQVLDSRAADLPDYVYQGGSIGRSIWGDDNP